ncbi:MAG: 50S ribosomal protein L5 [Patescibacteria group bacterium]
MTDLREKYQKEVMPALRKEFGFRNVTACPRIEKVIVHVGVGRIRDDKDHEEVKKFLALIVGQKPSARPAKKAIAAFKTRRGLIVGYQATLRGRRMYDFLSRLISAALPRTRDFRGIAASAFDERGNLTIGLREHIVFPEMIGEDYRLLFGMEVTVVTTARRREQGITLLKMMGFPIETKN